MRSLTAVALNIAQGSMRPIIRSEMSWWRSIHYGRQVRNARPTSRVPVLLRASPNHEVLRRLVRPPLHKPSMQ